jgi:hypothetical protein
LFNAVTGIGAFRPLAEASDLAEGGPDGTAIF